MKRSLLLLTVMLALAACGKTQPTQTPPPTAEPSPTQSPVPQATPTKPPVATPSPVQESPREARYLSDLPQPEPFTGAALPTERGTYFTASGVCVVCHRDMRDAAGRDVSIGEFWRGTMMANASRDPYWRAAVRAETLANPDLAAVIEDTCTRCHMPMARTTSAFAGEMGKALDDGYFDPQNPLHILGMEGVSCTLCHQIEATHLGEEQSFDGGYEIDATTPAGERVNYGPYEVSARSKQLMQASSGFIPQQGEHLQTPELCATCHTLYTPTVDANGEVVGLFPEQMPYKEWQHSDFAETQTCQDCHMPVAEGEVTLSITGSPPRSPFSKHVFAGGNTYALTLLRTFGPEIGLTADSSHIDAALERATEQLQQATAQIAIAQATVEGDTLTVVVQVTNLTGHKLPTAYPSRRVWIHLMVQDAQGQVVFESGGWRADGAIIGNDNDADPLAYEPHYETISSPEEVQIYEAIFVNTDGQVTTTLLRGNMYIKDNRLLPAGFDKETASDDIAVRGNAAQDADFVAGSDVVRYQVSLNGADGPFTITAELVYQSIGYRWAQKMRDYAAPEPQQFMAYYEQVPNLPVLITRAQETP